MTTTTATKSWGDKKTVYHSMLREASLPDGLCVKFTSPVRESKFEGKSDYIHFEVYGENGTPRTYNIEHEGISAYLRDTLQGVGDEWVIVTAEGTREGASVSVTFVTDEPTEDAPEVPPGQPAGLEQPLPFEQGSVVQQAAQANQEQALAASHASSAKATLYLDCLNAATQALKEFRDEHGRDPTDVEYRMGTTLYIGSRG